MIELTNATKTYDSGGGLIRAVDDVTLTVRDGEFVAVVGHSGSGKTTLVSLMGGLTKPTSGNIFIGGTDIWTLDNLNLARLRSEKIGFCFQFSSLIPTLNSIDNVRLPASFAGGERGGLERAMSLLETVGVTDKAKAYPAELSGGQQRRVAIARSLVNEPRIMLADEPTGDLDEQTEVDIMKLFQGLNQQGVTIVMVTHSQKLAAQAGRILTMTAGVVAEGIATGDAGV
ncbi:MAG: ABC transporter ATP-binding protein [Thermoleophilia bacterium]|nr:ABC transporter ATP-binding protein [Thermoleophilia bacterium]